MGNVEEIEKIIIYKKKNILEKAIDSIEKINPEWKKEVLYNWQIPAFIEELNPDFDPEKLYPLDKFKKTEFDDYIIYSRNKDFLLIFGSVEGVGGVAVTNIEPPKNARLYDSKKPAIEVRIEDLVRMRP